jgi:DNA invertase Pin-like site-specific DNA recombinase
LRALLLARVSTKHVEQDTSPDRQLARLDRLADAHGWTVVDRVVERTSGADVLGRPAIARALDKVIQNEADIIVVDHLFRLGRNVRELLEVLDTLKAVGGHFYDATNNLDTSGPLGRMIFTVYASVGEFEIADRKEKILEGLERAKARGVRLGKPPSVPPAVMKRALELRREEKADGSIPSWNEVRLLLQAEKLGKFSRGALSRGVKRLEQELAAL